MSKIEISIVSSFELAWNDRGSGANMDGSFYNPTAIPIGFNSMGSYGQGNYDSPNGSVVVVKEIEPGALAHPTDYVQVYNDKKSGSKMDGSFWLPIPPQGYTAMGVLCVSGYGKPSNADVVCLRDDLVANGSTGQLIWDDKKSGSSLDGSFWQINVGAGTIQTGLFSGTGNYNPSDAAPLVGIRHDAV